MGKPTSDGGGSNPVPENPLMSDDRPQQAGLDVADPTQYRESRIAEEQSEGGLFKDTRSDPDRGRDMGDALAGRQEELGFGVGDDEPDMSDFMP